MIERINICNILFLDIETVPQFSDYNKLAEKKRILWDKKSNNLIKNIEETAESIYNRAGIYAEFGKIVCISVGYILQSNYEYSIRIKSFYGDDEKLLLEQFINLLNNHFNKKENLLCAHNGKEFDYPYIARRIIINNLEMPEILNTAGKKPWEVSHLDTMELWKFGDYKSYTSLELLCDILEVENPKDDIDGSQVCGVYWKENNIAKIVKYCQKDVISTIQVFLRLTGKKNINKDNISIL